MTDWVSEGLPDWLADTLQSRFPFSLFFLSTFSPFFLGTVFCFHFLVYLQRPPPSPSIFLRFIFPFIFGFVLLLLLGTHTHTYVENFNFACLSLSLSPQRQCQRTRQVSLSWSTWHTWAVSTRLSSPACWSSSPPAYYPIPVLTACKTLWMTLSRFFIYFIAAAFTCLPRCCCCWYFMSIALRLADLCRLPPSGNCLSLAPSPLHYTLLGAA